MNIEPASLTIPASTWPAPIANGPAWLTRSLSVTRVLAVTIMADLAMAGVQSGCACFSNGYMPATTGLDMEVPAMAWNS